MKKIVILVAMMMAAGVANAATAMMDNGTSSIKGQLGFSQSAVNVGADYERRMNNWGWGGYVLLSTENSDAGKNQVLALGAMMPIHFYDDHAFSLYAAPGFGIAMIEGITPANSSVKSSDETIIGPSIKLGGEYAVTPRSKVGLEKIYLENWFNHHAVSEVSYVNATYSYAF